MYPGMSFDSPAHSRINLLNGRTHFLMNINAAGAEIRSPIAAILGRGQIVKRRRARLYRSASPTLIVLCGSSRSLAISAAKPLTGRDQSPFLL
jgi:hypothetical protein